MSEIRPKNSILLRNILKKISYISYIFLAIGSLIMAFAFTYTDVAVKLISLIPGVDEKLTLFFLLTAGFFISALSATIPTMAAIIAEQWALSCRKAMADYIQKNLDSLNNAASIISSESLDRAVLTQRSIDHFISNRNGPVIEGLQEGFNHFWRLQKGGIIPALTHFEQELKFCMVSAGSDCDSNLNGIFKAYDIPQELKSWTWLRVDINNTYKLPFSTYRLPPYLSNHRLLEMLLTNPGVMSFNLFVESANLWSEFNVDPFYPLPTNAYYMVRKVNSITRPEARRQNINLFRSMAFINGVDDSGEGILENCFHTSVTIGDHTFSVPAKPLFPKTSNGSVCNIVMNELNSRLGSKARELLEITKSKEFVNLYVHVIQRDGEFIEKINNIIGKDWMIKAKMSYIMPCFAEFKYLKPPDGRGSTLGRHIFMQDSYESPIGRLAKMRKISGATDRNIFFSTEAPITIYSFLPLNLEFRNTAVPGTQFYYECQAVTGRSDSPIYLYPSDIVLFRLRSPKLSQLYAEAFNRLAVEGKST